MYLFHTVTGDKIFIYCVVDSFCDVKRMKLNIKLFHVQAMEGGTYGALFHLTFLFFSFSFFLFFLSLRVNLQCSFPNRHAPFLTKIMFIIFTTSWYHIKGELHPQPKISMFSALSQNYKQIVKGTQKWYWNFSRPNSF